MKINTLIIGASHMGGSCIKMKQNAACILGKMSGETVYNVAMAGHYFPICAVNLKAALAKYNPSEFAVIETHQIDFSAREFAEILDGTVHRNFPIKAGQILLFLRENYFLALLHQQAGRSFAEEEVSHPQNSHDDENEKYNLLQQVLEMMGNTASEAGTKLIIAYHPSVSLNHDGTLSIIGNPDYAEKFAELCSQNGIYFLNMSDRFMIFCLTDS